MLRLVVFLKVLIPDEDDYCPFRVLIRSFPFHFSRFQRRVSSNVSYLPLPSLLAIRITSCARKLEPGPSGFTVRGCESIARAPRKSLWKSLHLPSSINTDNTIRARSRSGGTPARSAILPFDSDRASRSPSLPGVPPSRPVPRDDVDFFLADISGSLSRRLSNTLSSEVGDRLDRYGDT